MAIFLTGSTGYIGAHVASIVLQRHTDRLNLLVRAKTEQEAKERLWHALQLHMDFPELHEALETRISVFRGDLTEPHFGLDAAEYTHLVGTTESVIHCAASLNRKSEKTCLNVNLRGTLEVVQLARRAHDLHGLRRFSEVSTVAVAGHRSHEVVAEDASIDWNRSDYDPYARTKKFCEHMVREIASRCSSNRVSSEHRARRQPAARNYAIRYGPRLRVSGGIARFAVSPDGSNRYRAGGLRGRISCCAASKTESRA